MLKASSAYILERCIPAARGSGQANDLRIDAQHGSTGGTQMKRIVMRAALLVACAALALPAGLATADETSDLRAEIAAQRAQLEAQRLRLEALEKKLDATAAAQQAASQQAASQQAASQQAASQQGGSFKEALSNLWTSAPPQTAAERLVAAANDVGT